MSNNSKCAREYIIENLHLVRSDSETDFRIAGNETATKLYQSGLVSANTRSASELHRFFRNIKHIAPDKILRPAGDSTYFTSAGVQHVETILRETGDLNKTAFIIAQPVVRSQFLDKVRDGISTSFVNYSVEFVDSTPAEFIELCIDFIRLIVSQEKSLEDISIRIEESKGIWGKRKFSNIYFTVLYKGTELGECVYIYDFPVTEGRKIPISDICFGVERLNWALELSDYYIEGFDPYYQLLPDSNKMSAVIDSIKTATLLSGEGVVPSHKDPGYRLRQVMKRFLTRTRGMQIDMNDLIYRSYNFWKKWDVDFALSVDETIKVLEVDHERNYNVLFLETLDKVGGLKIYTNVSQSNKDFFDQIKHNIPKEMITRVIDQIE
ncbi:hypothetical protein KKB83_02825 [Patescibacteria group bacterium]|nr:hypothetical protein [Patescibacteria group bacterium]